MCKICDANRYCSEAMWPHHACDLLEGEDVPKRPIPVLPKIKTGTYRLIKEGNDKIL